MRSALLEAWIGKIIDRVETGKPIEDSRVELKGLWPTDHRKAARQLAGLANASHGGVILWLIGIDEIKGVLGAANEELSDWWDQVQSHYDELAPSMINNIDVHTPKGTVIGLLFETERAPFVIKVLGEGNVHREVPWREGNATRTATRTNLLRILVSRYNKPSIELMKVTLKAEYERPSNPIEMIWFLEIIVYIVSHPEARIIIPSHKCTGVLTINYFKQPNEKGRISFDKPRGEHLSMIQSTPNDLIIDGPGKVVIRGYWKTYFTEDTAINGISANDMALWDIKCEIELNSFDGDNVCNINFACDFEPRVHSDKGPIFWIFNPYEIM